MAFSHWASVFLVGLSVFVLRTQGEFKSQECSSSLGMENRLIKDAQITAASQYHANYAANQARLNFKAGRVKQGGWSALWNNANQWIQVALGGYTKITGIATQGRNRANQWVTKYKLQFSDDGVKFHYYKAPGQSSPKVFNGNKDRDSIVYHKLNPPIQSRYIRLRPTAWYSRISMRMELYGCMDCSAPLGMESGFIKDFQITASSQNDANHAAIQGRLNFKAGGGKRGGWSTFWNNANQWIQVALGSYTKLTSIATQGRNGHSQWVTKYKLQYSDDGVNFHYYKEPGQSSPKVFDGNKDRDSIVYHKLNPPIQAHYIRLRPTAWYGHISLRMELYGCLVQCPVLALHSLVKTSPSGCLTSQMKFNTTCSFSCPQGYQLQGPSYKHCRINGQWTDSAKSVSCNDADECSVSNGGCSHKCVNTAGGYKCKCPDPELSLALDNMTCHAPGVDVQCNRDSLTIIIPKSLLRGIDREHLRLLDTTCKAKETNADFSLTTPLTGCNTTRRQTPTAIVYSNTVLEIPVAAEDVITRVREIEIQFSCFYSKYGVVSSVGWKPSNRKLVFNDEGKGNFTLSLKMFPDKRFVSPYTKDDFPVAVVLRKLLFFEVSVTSGDKQLSIMADRCYATPTLDQQNSLKYEFITKGCPIDNTVKYHAAPLVSAQRFSLEAFNFIADHPFVFVHCHVIVCDGTDPGSKCSKKCLSSGRGRREVSDHMFGVYALSQGPLHLARQRREKKSANGLNKSGSSPIFLMALLVMCVACLVGTVVLIYKKSRDKPAGYSMLVSGEKE